MNVGTAVAEGSTESPDQRAGAWDRFYAHCFAIINQCPLVRRLNEADRDDCVQEVMVEVVRKLGARPPDEARDELTGWIRTVSRNKAADMTRRRYRKPEVGFDDGAGATIVDSPDGGAANVEASEALGLLWEALLTLDEEVTMSSYVIFYLRNIENWPIADIARAFSLSSEQTRFRCHRVRKRLAAILKEKDPSAAGNGAED
jgi:RNA polymerase sigma factor (sigma-70 family)